MNWKSAPQFLQTIIEKFNSGQSNQFILYGNVRDLYSLGKDQFYSLIDCLKRLMDPPEGDQRRIIAYYDLISGVQFRNQDDLALVESILGKAELQKYMQDSIQHPLQALVFLQELSKISLHTINSEKQGWGFIINHVESLIHRQESNHPNEVEQRKAMIFHQWFTDPAFIRGRHLAVLITQTLAELNETVVELPFVTAIQVPRPSDTQRQRYLRFLKKQHQVSLGLKEKDAVFYTGGLTLQDLQKMFMQANHTNTKLTAEMIFKLTQEVIEKELSGNIEFPIINYDFSDVIGAKKLLAKLEEMKSFIMSGNSDLMPTGILVPGPNGVGKTYTFKAFAKECGYLPVIIKNVRGQYVGQTEMTWERIRSILEVMGNVMVIYDEADTELGGRSAGTHDVDKRLFGAILRMMSDPNNRGKIIWIIITARPDKLEPDIKRTGRAGEHLPVFDPEGQEREEFINFVLSKVGLSLDNFLEDHKRRFLDHTASYSPADFVQFLTNLERKKHLTSRNLTVDEILEIGYDFIPDDISLQRQLQELLAFVECSYQSLIPEKYVDMTKQEAYTQISELKILLGEN
ncbi:TPA: AAA family ATPase [Candidatus Poribacteria bacterium]|nr:AAA family ATPase [Candidatus Poribacteria bacterium]HIC02252.1 AAA family ATPase [Candidatus Poribacteria bacterium]HIO47917.1 AAA family ATPase [Candidatus Poribacteria bacterium]HIO77685.1 AAA family ATPase [Candidatus Poribacteria bacterium]